MILFLDFDGVLHPEYDGQATPADVVFCHLPRFEAVMRDHPEVEIVISSMWREQFPLDALLDQLPRFLALVPRSGKADGGVVAKCEP